MKAIQNYFIGAIHEFKNITWPTEAETVRIAKITVVFIGVCTALFFLADGIFSILLVKLSSFF
ncbi:MAG: preprotein translocase subunit SecE [Candidatus Peregrinibacteria bacterium]